MPKVSSVATGWTPTPKTPIEEEARKIDLVAWVAGRTASTSLPTVGLLETLRRAHLAANVPTPAPFDGTDGMAALSTHLAEALVLVHKIIAEAESRGHQAQRMNRIDLALIASKSRELDLLVRQTISMSLEMQFMALKVPAEIMR